MSASQIETTRVLVASRSGIVHLGYTLPGGIHRAMCGQAGKFGRARTTTVTCSKCSA